MHEHEQDQEGREQHLDHGQDDVEHGLRIARALT
jgi:hypothetical protein